MVSWNKMDERFTSSLLKRAKAEGEAQENARESHCGGTCSGHCAHCCKKKEQLS